MTKYNRSNFYDTSIVDGINESDLSTNKWKDFRVLRPATYYTITDRDLNRPDLISYFLYGRIDYWWILARINTIDDFFNDLSVGDVLIVPDKLDIEDFYVKISNS